MTRSATAARPRRSAPARHESTCAALCKARANSGVRIHQLSRFVTYLRRQVAIERAKRLDPNDSVRSPSPELICSAIALERLERLAQWVDQPDDRIHAHANR